MTKEKPFDASAFKAKREKDNISAEKLGKLFGTSKENIYKWESGTVPNSKAMVKKVQDYLNGVQPKPAQMKVVKTNGAVKKDEYKEMFEALREEHFILLKKYTILLEQKSI